MLSVGSGVENYDTFLSQSFFLKSMLDLSTPNQKKLKMINLLRVPRLWVHCRAVAAHMQHSVFGGI